MRPRIPSAHLQPLALATALLVALLALVSLSQAAYADPIDDQVRQIAKQLQCPVCESVSVADSPSTLATQMRGIIREKVEAGESEQQIIQYFIDRYGDEVLVEPPKRGLSLAVWWAPVAILVGGVGLLFVVLRSWLRQSRVPPPESRVTGSWTRDAGLETRDSGLDERVVSELEQYRRELER